MSPDKDLTIFNYVYLNCRAMCLNFINIDFPKLSPAAQSYHEIITFHFFLMMIIRLGWLTIHVFR